MNINLAQIKILSLGILISGFSTSSSYSFEVVETTISDVHMAFANGELTAKELVQLYLDRIEAYDQAGPEINSIIVINEKALSRAEELDAIFIATGPVGPLHGIPVLLKDQMDTVGMATTLGSVLLKDYYPEKDAFVTTKLEEAGAIILAKVTLGELAGGDTYGSLFGATKNPYALDRTAGGSSGGTGASVAANFGIVGLGQEAYASIRRPSSWNGIVGMRPTAGLVSRSGVYSGWPGYAGSLGPMTRTVKDMAILLDVMVGYDAEDPLTAYCVREIPETYTSFLDPAGLRGARIGVIRESLALNSEPDKEDFKEIERLFDTAVKELIIAGAVIVDDIRIPGVRDLIRNRSSGPDGVAAWETYFRRNESSPFKYIEEMYSEENVALVSPHKRLRARTAETEPPAIEPHYHAIRAREELMVNFLQVMAEHDLDVLLHRSVEHNPNLIVDGMNPPFLSTRGVSNINTFLAFASSMTVPAGFTHDGLPVGITFLGRGFDEGKLIKMAYAYEQYTKHRKPPASTPPLK